MKCDTCNGKGKILAETFKLGRMFFDRESQQIAHECIGTGIWNNVPCPDCCED